MEALALHGPWLSWSLVCGGNTRVHTQHWLFASSATYHTLKHYYVILNLVIIMALLLTVVGIPHIIMKNQLISDSDVMT